MKKYIYNLMVMLFSISFIALVSCNDDNPLEEGNKIEINGVSYNLSMVGFMGSWNEGTSKGEFSVAVDNVINGVTYVDYYNFSFKSVSGPKVGNDFAQMDLALTPLNDKEDGSIGDLQDSFIYTSGKAIVTNTNPSESEIGIKFEQLKMSHDGKDYIFNGYTTLMFEY